MNWYTDHMQLTTVFLADEEEDNLSEEKEEESNGFEYITGNTENAFIKSFRGNVDMNDFVILWNKNETEEMRGRITNKVTQRSVNTYIDGVQFNLKKIFKKQQYIAKQLA
jgi:hypothetical protein